jgi:hypothetical protein
MAKENIEQELLVVVKNNPNQQAYVFVNVLKMNNYEKHKELNTTKVRNLLKKLEKQGLVKSERFLLNGLPTGNIKWVIKT